MDEGKDFIMFCFYFLSALGIPCIIFNAIHEEKMRKAKKMFLKEKHLQAEDAPC